VIYLIGEICEKRGDIFYFTPLMLNLHVEKSVDWNVKEEIFF